MNVKTSVIIPAAGFGKRMKSDIPKQFLELNGKPIIWLTTEKFQNHSEIDEIIIVGPKEKLGEIRDIISEFSKVKHVIEGGRERQDSVWNGFQKIDDETDFVLVHDAARPFVNSETISRVIQELKFNPCVITGIQLTSTIKTVQNDNFVDNTIDRNRIREIQTPQGMHVNTFRSAYNQAYKDKFYGTDEAMIAEYFGIPVKIVEGDRTNIKITTPEDIDLGHFLMEKSQQK